MHGSYTIAVVAHSNPKIASMPVVVIALAAVQFGTIMLAISELTNTGGPRLDRGLRSFAVLGVLWVAVVVADLVLHPTMRMTRLLTGGAFKTAFVITTVHAVFAVGDALLGTSLSSPIHRVASLGAGLAVLWALTSLWGLVREWRNPSASEDRQEEGARHHVTQV